MGADNEKFPEIEVLDDPPFKYVKWAIEDCILIWDAGLKDMNGKEVYTGDIITFIPEPNSMRIRDWDDPNVDIRTVDWVEDEARFGFFWTNGKQQTSGYTFTKSNLNSIVKVIGNKYENPELLKEGE